MFRTKAAIV